MARKRTVRRRRSSTGRGLSGFASAAAKPVIAGTAGFVVSDQIARRVPFGFAQSGAGMYLTQAAVGLLGGYMLSRFTNRSVGIAFATGAMTNVATKAIGGFGLSGLGSAPIGSLGAAQPMLRLSGGDANEEGISADAALAMG